MLCSAERRSMIRLLETALFAALSFANCTHPNLVESES